MRSGFEVWRGLEGQYIPNALRRFHFDREKAPSNADYQENWNRIPFDSRPVVLLSPREWNNAEKHKSRFTNQYRKND